MLIINSIMTNNLTSQEIDNYLQGYTRITTSELSATPLNTHMRYFIRNGDGHLEFRKGGFLQVNEHCDRYVILTNGSMSWSVQVASAIFFRQNTEVVRSPEITISGQFTITLKSN